jgi:hypothetical protein
MFSNSLSILIKNLPEALSNILQFSITLIFALTYTATKDILKKRVIIHSKEYKEN